MVEGERFDFSKTAYKPLQPGGHGGARHREAPTWATASGCPATARWTTGVYPMRLCREVLLGYGTTHSGCVRRSSSAGYHNATSPARIRLLWSSVQTSSLASGSRSSPFAGFRKETLPALDSQGSVRRAMTSSEESASPPCPSSRQRPGRVGAVLSARRGEPGERAGHRDPAASPDDARDRRVRPDTRVHGGSSKAQPLVTARR